jgi:hypothetical protein
MSWFKAINWTYVTNIALDWMLFVSIAALMYVCWVVFFN